MRLTGLILRSKSRLILLALVATVPTIAAIECYTYSDNCPDGSQVSQEVCCESNQTGIVQCGCTSWTAGPNGGTYSGCGEVGSGRLDPEEQ
jgi:hypothetical protein